MSFCDQLTVVIRTADERTAAASAHIVAQQLGRPPLVVRERPFAKALAHSIALAIQANAQWTLLLDADILLRRNALHRIVEVMKSEPSPFYVYSFAVLDYGFGGPAYAGVHGYATALLPKAFELSSNSMDAQRPETHLAKQMERDGHRSVRARVVVGLHDYEQYLRDLYRKSFVRAFKFKPFTDYMCARLKPHLAASPEHQMMSIGLADGIRAARTARVASLDSAAYKLNSDRALSFLGIEERAPLDGTSFPDLADSHISNFRADGLYEANARWLAPAGYEL